jgi:hypothetical protein
MRQVIRLAVVLLGLCLILALPGGASAQCPGNLAANFSFEEGLYKGETVGTSLSSWLSVNWLPWAVLGDQQINREIEFFVVDGAILQEGYYRVHHGRYAQKFFSGYSTHHAGFYQRVPVTPGQKVTFSIWVQIATGQQEFWSWGLPISDLSAPGNYKVWAGIDPYGGTPPGFGAFPPASTVWSASVIDRETRMLTADGHEYDGWVELSVSAVAQSNYVTVYTRGNPEFPVKNNSSFWDDACVVASAPPPPTAAPTNTPTETPLASPTPSVTDTPPATATPQPTETPVPTNTPTETPVPTDTPTLTPQPTDTPVPTPTETPVPTETPAAIETPATVVPTETPVGLTEADAGAGSLWIPVVGAVGVAAAAYAIWRLTRRS